MQDLEIRSYLEDTVMPILLEAMGEMAKTKYIIYLKDFYKSNFNIFRPKN